MSQANSTTSLQSIAKYLIVLIVIAFISTLFPNNIRFKYQFDKGERWKYEELIAPFEFPIKKSEAEMAADIAEREKSFSPYYEMNLDILKQQRLGLEASFKAQLDAERGSSPFQEVFEQTDRYLRFGKNFLDKIYENGIIELSSEHKSKGKDFVINVIKGNVTQKEAVGNLLTVQKAQELLSDSLPYSPLKEPEFLLPILEKLIRANVLYSKERTEQFKADFLKSIPDTKGIVKEMELIVPENGIITDEIYDKLLSYREAYKEQVIQDRSPIGIFIGYFILTALIIGVFLLYLQRFAREQFKDPLKLIFLFLWLVIYSYLVYIFDLSNALSAYMIPFCIVPIVIKHFYGTQLALFTHVIIVLIASFLSSLGYEFTLMQIIAGIIAVLGRVDSRDLSQFFYVIISIFLAYAFTYLGLSLIQADSLENIDWNVYTWLFVNAVLILLAYPLIPILERLFGFTSPSSLLELSDVNRPLLQRLSSTAPGTFQHSLQVGNLSEAAAREIDADHLLVKVAALYHDIGKIQNPSYYIENQNGNNPHDQLTPAESAKMIIAHVTEGLKLAKKQRLPKVIVDFIATHHGDTRVEYFYRKHLEANPNTKVNEGAFRYPGPKPTTREQTIMMLADSIEAACKSLKSPTGKDIDDMIDKIISSKMAAGQLSASTLTFEDMEKVQSVFKRLLRSIHHVRVEYPPAPKSPLPPDSTTTAAAVEEVKEEVQPQVPLIGLLPQADPEDAFE